MAQRTQTQTPARDGRHQHRTAKVIELMGTSDRGFEEAIQNALTDASETLRGINGAHVQNFSVTCDNGRITEYKVDVKIAFGIERSNRS